MVVAYLDNEELINNINMGTVVTASQSSSSDGQIKTKKKKQSTW
jgi:hypothetical protein